MMKNDQLFLIILLIFTSDIMKLLSMCVGVFLGGVMPLGLRDLRSSAKD